MDLKPGTTKYHKGDVWRTQATEMLLELFKARSVVWWLDFSRAVKFNYQYNRWEFAKRGHTAEKRNITHEAGLSRFMLLKNLAEGYTLPKCVVDIVFRRSEGEHHQVQLKVPTDGAGQWPHIGQVISMCSGRWAMQVLGNTKNNAKTGPDSFIITKIIKLRLIPLWLYPPEAYKIMEHPKDPGKVMLNLAKGVTDEVEPWHPFDDQDPKTLGLHKLPEFQQRTPAYIYIPTRIKEVMKSETAPEPDNKAK